MFGHFLENDMQTPPLSPRLLKVAYTVLGLIDFSTTFSVFPDLDENNFDYVSEDYNKMNKILLENIFSRKKMLTNFFIEFFLGNVSKKNSIKSEHNFKKCV